MKNKLFISLIIILTFHLTNAQKKIFDKDGELTKIVDKNNKELGYWTFIKGYVTLADHVYVVGNKKDTLLLSQNNVPERIEVTEEDFKYWNLYNLFGQNSSIVSKLFYRDDKLLEIDEKGKLITQKKKILTPPATRLRRPLVLVSTRSLPPAIFIWSTS